MRGLDRVQIITRRQGDELVVTTEFPRNGAGTVCDVEAARRCLEAGATFLTSPGLNIELVEFALKNNVVVFPGALTPSEILAAWKAGADFVKVFPCSVLGGAKYIAALRSPFPGVPLIAAGGGAGAGYKGGATTASGAAIALRPARGV